MAGSAGDETQVTVNDQLAAAIAQGRAATFAQDAQPDGAEAATLERLCTALDRISADMRALKAGLVKTLTDQGCAAEGEPGPEDSGGLQYPEVSIRIAPDALGQAAIILAAEGFEAPFVLTPGRLAALRRYQSALRLVRFDGDTTRVALMFADSRAPSRLRPSMSDIAASGLPPRLTGLLRLSRLSRVALDRLTGRPKGGADTEFLGTPQSLIQPLLDLVGPGEGRHLVDLGCGDGRIILAAAKAGWRATGVELNPDLAEKARANIAAAGLEDRVSVLCQPAQDTDLTDADVVFLFLPLYILGPILENLRRRADFSGQIVLHEQQALPPTLAPDRSLPVISETALTVAHVWDS